jgi:DNA replication protein DnaC
MQDIIILLDKLGLTGMKMSIEEELTGANKEDLQQLHCALKKSLEAEVEYRSSRSLRYKLRLAKFPGLKLLSETEQAKLVKNIDVERLVGKHENIILVGGSGSGKTHLAIGLGYQAIECGYRVKYYTLNELAAQLVKASQHNYEIQFIEAVKRFHLVIVDELGYVPIKSDSQAHLFELFAKLYEQASIIIATHLRFEEWSEIFGNNKATKAIIDRLTHHCHIIETGNISFRGGLNRKQGTQNEA